MLKKLPRSLAIFSVVTAFFWSGTASALPYSNLVVFGDSLADSGNNAILADLFASGAREPAPFVGPQVATLPYASGTYSNGPVWTEYFASSLGMSLAPSLAGGNNYAYGGARVGVDGLVPSLVSQMGLYLSGNAVNANTLYVIEGGGNDARDVLGLYAAGMVQEANAAVTNYVQGIVGMLGTLASLGAEHFLLWNITDLGQVPAVTAMGLGASAGASMIVDGMNQAMYGALNTYLPGSILDDIVLFDAFNGLRDIVANPAAFGLSNVTDACADQLASPNCIANSADQYFFWDGIHPTTAGHAVMAQLAVAALPEPSSWALFGLAFLGLAASRRRAYR